MAIICTSLLHHILIFTAICIPVQVIIIPLDCNRNIPNINFRSHITLAVNWWLLIHFLYLSISYSYYNVIALFYRLCCTAWMAVYCHPNETHNIYHWFKRQLPDWTRPFLRKIRDKLIFKVWRNFRAIIERRRRKETMVDNASSLWTALHNKPKVLWLSLYVISCISFSCLLKYYTGWDLTMIIPILLLYLLLRYDFYEEFEDIVSQLRSLGPNTFISYSKWALGYSDSRSSYGRKEMFVIEPPIQCTEFEFSSELEN